MKFKKDKIYEEIKEFALIHCNPSVWAIQEVFNLDYLTAVKYRMRLKDDGFFQDFSANKGGFLYLNVCGNTIYVK